MGKMRRLLIEDLHKYVISEILINIFESKKKQYYFDLT